MWPRPLQAAVAAGYRVAGRVKGSVGEADERVGGLSGRAAGRLSEIGGDPDRRPVLFVGLLPPWRMVLVLRLALPCEEVLGQERGDCLQGVY